MGLFSLKGRLPLLWFHGVYLLYIGRLLLVLSSVLLSLRESIEGWQKIAMVMILFLLLINYMTGHFTSVVLKFLFTIIKVIWIVR